MKNKTQKNNSYFNSKKFNNAMDKAVKVSNEEQRELVKRVEVLENFEEELRTFGNLCWERKGEGEYASCQHTRVIETFKEALQSLADDLRLKHEEKLNTIVEAQRERHEQALLTSAKVNFEMGAIDERKRIVDMIEIRDATTLDQEPVKPVLQYILKEIEQI